MTGKECLANTSTASDSVVVIGGMSFPIINTPAIIGTCQNFVAQTASFHSPTEWFLRIVFENTAVNIVSASYDAETTGRTVLQSDTYFSWIDAAYYTIFSGKPLLRITDDTRTVFLLKGSFKLTDSYTYNFEVNMQQNYAGGIAPITKVFNLIGSGTMCREVTGGGGSTETSTVFKPSGFGVKQLGIADYKKVEQTVHCYVEGEVAHIENIMAREYKEKSTRRLRRSENTTTTSSESESEHLSDTTSTDRFEMQNEVAKVLQNSKDFSANASVGYSGKAGPGTITINAGANYATHSSKEQSTRAAITEAKDITQRAMDRVVTRVKEERIEKIIEEFEENNKHGFDNTKGDKHVVGVYRWVDKIYKNQVYNYGKRLMFEFMIPEPSKLHRLGMIENVATPTTATLLEKPIDPRTINLPDASALSEYNYKSWAAKYGASVNPCPLREICIGKSLDFNVNDPNKAFTKSDSIDIPDGYLTSVAQINFAGMEADPRGWDRKVIATVGNLSRLSYPMRIDVAQLLYLAQYQKTIPISISSTNFFTCTVAINVSCPPPRVVS